MAVIKISLAPGVPSYRQRVVLDGREYGLVLRWSQHEERWYLDLFDARGELVAGAIKLLGGRPLLERLRGVGGLPPGELVIVDARTPSRDPGLADLGDVAQLVYLDAGTLEELLDDDADDAEVASAAAPGVPGEVVD